MMPTAMITGVMHLAAPMVFDLCNLRNTQPIANGLSDPVFVGSKP
jgi:hypothetical protein